MGGWSTVGVLLIETVVTFAYKINYSQTMPVSNNWSGPKEFVSLYPQSEYYDLTEAETSKPLFNSIFWAPPIQLDHTIDITDYSGRSKIKNEGPNTSSNDLGKDQDRSFQNEVAAREGKDDSVVEYQESRPTYDNVDEAAIEKEAEAFVEKDYHEQQDSNRNRRENYDEATSGGYERKYAVVETPKSEEDHRGEGSDYGHHSYIQYDEHEPKKKKEIHYHQHKHLHEHDHLQEHKHHHLDEHQDKHYHEHKQNDDHKHYHEAKHEHKEKAEHYHKQYADHKHEHHQDHKHGHKNEHWHEHKQEARHEHKGKHEHHHKEDAKHHHEKKAEHNHHHHHKHEEESKHHHNHWSEHKHGHDHHHGHKHNHDHNHQHKGHQKIRVHYKKRHGW